MQILPLFLVLVLIAADEPAAAPLGLHVNLPPLGVVAAAWGPVMVIVLLFLLAMRSCRRQMDRGRGHGPIIVADQLMRAARWLIVANHAVAVLLFGWLGTIRHEIGNLILIDELVALMPPLFGLVAIWWAHYPIERRIHEALLIRRLDDGRPVYPVLNRRQFVMLQVRLNLLLMLVLILLILGCKELIAQASDALVKSPSAAKVTADVATTIVAVCLFVLSPLLARWLLDVRPLPPGPTRDDLLAVCRRHRVGMRDLLLWNTNGTMINAAVMGLIGPLRYVMITDALLEMLREDQVRAVMAHEIGHVRRHHMPWLVGCLMACFALALIAVELVLLGADALHGLPDEATETATIAVNGAPLILGLLMFGWVSRRFERQADTFAVQHLSGLGLNAETRPRPGEGNEPAITQESVWAMRGALAIIADLNTLDPDRRSWRHGSIAWRQAYLKTLIGKPILKLPIDRLIRKIKLAAALVIIVAVAGTVWLNSHEPAGQEHVTQATAGEPDQRASINAHDVVHHAGTIR